MKRSSGTSVAEKELVSVVKSVWKTGCKLKDRRVKIEGKPYIKGFDIDIFVPELMRGIEFDGTYYHSFEFMRKQLIKNLGQMKTFITTTKSKMLGLLVRASKSFILKKKIGN